MEENDTVACCMCILVTIVSWVHETMRVEFLSLQTEMT